MMCEFHVPGLFEIFQGELVVKRPKHPNHPTVAQSDAERNSPTTHPITSVLWAGLRLW